MASTVKVLDNLDVLVTIYTEPLRVTSQSPYEGWRHIEGDVKGRVNRPFPRYCWLYLPNPRFQSNFDSLCFDSIYSRKKEIEELSLSHLFLSPKSMSYQSWKQGFGKYKRLSPCAYQINPCLAKGLLMYPRNSPPPLFMSIV